jgi:cellulose synthase/poly-beta-1,6-N-acetylglucosamine synthase-like glycosyltransferase
MVRSLSSPTVSVVVTARNEEHTVRDCLSALIKQDYPSYEILFVDAGSQDRTVAIAQDVARDNSNLKILNHSGNPSQCRNMAIKRSGADVVAFTDADVVVPPNWLKTTVETLFSNPKIGGVGGPNQPTRERSGEIIKAVDRMLTTSLGSMRSAQSYNFKERSEVKSIPCCNATYPRKVLLEIGGFNEDLVGCDDTDLGYRIRHTGRKLVYEPGARVLHAVKFDTLGQFSRLMFKYGRGRGYAARRKRYLFSGPAIPASAIIVGVPLLLFVTAVLGSALPLLDLFLLYFIAVEAYSVAVAVTKRAPTLAVFGPVVLATEHISYFLGFLFGLLDHRASRWS